MDRLDKAVSGNTEKHEWIGEDFVSSRTDLTAPLEPGGKYRRGRGPQKRPKKVQTTLRLSPDVLEFFRKLGPGWQKKIDEALKEWKRKNCKHA